METQVILLRKLAMKSKMPGGKYEGQLISLLADCNMNYLRWTYYFRHNFSFTDEVLDKIGITPEFRIDKPGVSDEMYERFRNHRVESWTEKDKLKRYLKKKTNRKHKLRSLERSVNCSKSYHMNKNRQ